MIHYVKGNILESGCTHLVNPVNCVGVMGKGLALSFKQAFPEMMKSYQEACRNGLSPGKLHTFYSTKNKVTIINFPTKIDWRNPSQYSYIVDGLLSLRTFLSSLQASLEIEDLEAYSIAIPPLGCGNGGLDYKIVRVMIEKALSNFDLNIYCYEPT